MNHMRLKQSKLDIHPQKLTDFPIPEYLRPEEFNFPEGNWIKDFRRLWPAIQIISKASTNVSNEKNDVMTLVDDHLRRLRLFGHETCMAAKVRR